MDGRLVAEVEQKVLTDISAGEECAARSREATGIVYAGCTDGRKQTCYTRALPAEPVSSSRSHSPRTPCPTRDGVKVCELLPVGDQSRAAQRNGDGMPNVLPSQRRHGLCGCPVVGENRNVKGLIIAAGTHLLGYMQRFRNIVARRLITFVPFHVKNMEVTAPSGHDGSRGAFTFCVAQARRGPQTGLSRQQRPNFAAGLLLDAEERIALRDALGARRRTRLDLTAAGRDDELRSLDGLRDGAGLVGVEEERVARLLLDGRLAFKVFCYGGGADGYHSVSA
ncbi:hypothetical protein DFH11DRAFT_1878541 [Phellopilus nigrolimitatus]|nr:hypothetical protein DFH11DRAFT_1878541 [Phellopilus nigrolimitatus]